MEPISFLESVSILRHPVIDPLEGPLIKPPQDDGGGLEIRS